MTGESASPGAEYESVGIASPPKQKASARRYRTEAISAPARFASFIAFDRYYYITLAPPA
jgi:hypothetical protein